MCPTYVSINANPVESDMKVDTCNLLPECKPDSDHSVSPLQENGSSVKESDISDQDEDQAAAIDLNACSEIVYHHQDDGTHGVKYICDRKEGWTPVIGKRRKYKVPTRLIGQTKSTSSHSSNSTMHLVDLKVILTQALTVPYIFHLVPICAIFCLSWKTWSKSNIYQHLYLDTHFFENSIQTYF